MPYPWISKYDIVLLKQEGLLATTELSPALKHYVYLIVRVVPVVSVVIKLVSIGIQKDVVSGPLKLIVKLPCHAPVLSWLYKNAVIAWAESKYLPYKQLTFG